QQRLSHALMLPIGAELEDALVGPLFVADDAGHWAAAAASTEPFHVLELAIARLQCQGQGIKKFPVHLSRTPLPLGPANQALHVGQSSRQQISTEPAERGRVFGMKTSAWRPHGMVAVAAVLFLLAAGVVVAGVALLRRSPTASGVSFEVGRWLLQLGTVLAGT